MSVIKTLFMKKTIYDNVFDVTKVPNYVDQTYKTHL